MLVQGMIEMIGTLWAISVVMKRRIGGMIVFVFVIDCVLVI